MPSLPGRTIMNTSLLGHLRQPRKIVLLFAVVVITSMRTQNPLTITEHDDLHQIYLSAPLKNNPSFRCIDHDDETTHDATTCECPDPLQAASRPNYDWAKHHQRYIQSIQAVELELDVVFLGDSITEHWNGTRRMGTVPLPSTYRASFARYFDSEHAPLKGLLLGTSGDTVVELLWHLQNGVLNVPTLQPSVWVLLIGTNDLGRWKCSKRTVLAAILHVAQYLHQQRPNATILLHGLLPRSEDDLDTSQLGKYWQDIRFINRELRKFVDMHPGEWFYMDASTVFLQRAPKAIGNADTQGSVQLKAQYMPDGLHPNVEGYEQWAPLLVDAIVKRLPRPQSIP
ncbi:platelet-activating factor acetylhydrolase [Fistulifera solaris]|uniref:Platelet-activating factor acetylhydrolase n=1 Tax=Fistulifera solaris TaxID=1519565 RepID=A0A1Z5JAZ6_FISSO|nr:platelet-activating factor acetylhydrolase [Fistulifera solaris]|eukprot:GAX10931.1 platelet-activating factor acetylhydrolase [Fistulifera solaris]